MGGILGGNLKIQNIAWHTRIVQTVVVEPHESVYLLAYRTGCFVRNGTVVCFVLLFTCFFFALFGDYNYFLYYLLCHVVCLFVSKAKSV